MKVINKERIMVIPIVKKLLNSSFQFAHSAKPINPNTQVIIDITSTICNGCILVKLTKKLIILGEYIDRKNKHIHANAKIKEQRLNFIFIKTSTTITDLS